MTLRPTMRHNCEHACVLACAFACVLVRVRVLCARVWPTLFAPARELSGGPWHYVSMYVNGLMYEYM